MYVCNEKPLHILKIYGLKKCVNCNSLHQVKFELITVRNYDYF